MVDWLCARPAGSPSLAQGTVGGRRERYGYGYGSTRPPPHHARYASSTAWLAGRHHHPEAGEVGARTRRAGRPSRRARQPGAHGRARSTRQGPSHSSTAWTRSARDPTSATEVCRAPAPPSPGGTTATAVRSSSAAEEQPVPVVPVGRLDRPPDHPQLGQPGRVAPDRPRTVRPGHAPSPAPPPRRGDQEAHRPRPAQAGRRSASGPPSRPVGLAQMAEQAGEGRRPHRVEGAQVGETVAAGQVRRQGPAEAEHPAPLGRDQGLQLPRSGAAAAGGRPGPPPG